METTDAVRIVGSLLIIAVGTVLAARRIRFLVRLVRLARPMPERSGPVGEKLRYQLRQVAGQEKLLQWTGPGIFHFLIFWGFLILQSQSLEALGEVVDPDFHIPLIGRSNLLGFAQDLFTVLVLVAVIGFACYRLAQRPASTGRASRFAGSNLDQGWYVLLLEFGLLYTVMVLRA
ncbi:MAG: Fe-S oxidoreductase, partial [Actinomycetota bacterium]|nr:Fe-S oxidoreductase [Actinomycetota bacterium]